MIDELFLSITNLTRHFLLESHANIFILANILKHVVSSIQAYRYFSVAKHFKNLNVNNHSHLVMAM